MPLPEPGPADDAATLFADVDSLFAPHWPFHVGRLRAPSSGPNEVPLRSLATVPAMRECLAAFATMYPGQDRRALASLWIQWYLGVAWPPLFAAALFCGRLPTLDDPRAALVIDAEGRTEALAAVDPVIALDVPDRVVDGLVHAHAEPLIEAVSEAAGMAPRVAWSNASNVLGWFLVEASAFGDRQALAPGWRLLREPRTPDGHRNPLHVPGAPVEGERPERRVCCLRYRLGNHGYCADCPIPPHRRP